LPPGKKPNKFLFRVFRFPPTATVKFDGKENAWNSFVSDPSIQRVGTLNRFYHAPTRTSAVDIYQQVGGSSMRGSEMPGHRAKKRDHRRREIRNNSCSARFAVGERYAIQSYFFRAYGRKALKVVHCKSLANIERIDRDQERNSPATLIWRES
jgi:hypothetical protein